MKCSRINGSLFHTCGGHVFNTRNEDVWKLFWSFFDQDTEFRRSERNSSVIMPDGIHVPYPIEDHVYLFNDDILNKVIQDLITLKSEKSTANNFKEFLINKFGATLYELYFKPYNEKIWKCDLSEIPLEWLEGKLPMPRPEQILFNNIRKIDEKEFVHSTFWYEINNGSQFIVDRLAESLDVRLNTPIYSIRRENQKWLVNGEVFDGVVYTGDIRKLPQILHNVKWDSLAESVSKFECHGTTSVFCEIDDNPYSWVYLPDSKYNAHRIICTGNFESSNNSNGHHTGTVEFTDEVDKEEIEQQLLKVPFNPHYITHKYNPMTYPIQNFDTRKIVAEVKETLAPMNFWLVGRFAEWEYFNMDKAMESALNLAKSITQEFKK